MQRLGRDEKWDRFHKRTDCIFSITTVDGKSVDAVVLPQRAHHLHQ